ncbi:MAG: hypothetical protein LBR07_02895 [Puniceicoccales bacterium]|nr:hypothetical protein [Puniceicoccales bacterium]
MPSFRNLTPDILALLTHALATGEKLEMSVITAWAEKLLRFCEINQSRLRRRANEKWGAAAGSQMAMLASFFCDFFLKTNDFRFLNLLLKLADLRWLDLPAKLRARIDSEFERIRHRRTFPS